ncbi:MAG: ATP-dependent DNA helicase RecG [Nevskiaceae bacterium]|nr:MAG: ATP-dependent DNA helicase RecG [Nevskiaceae bacterium]
MTESTASRPRQRPTLTLQSSAAYLKGAGPALAQRLRALDLERVQDLLFHLPSRYEDRRQIVPLQALRDGEEALIRAQVLQADVRYAGRRSLRVLLEQGDATLLLRFFHFNEAQRRAFAPGRWLLGFGTCRFGAQGWEMVHPQYRLADAAEALQPEQGLTPIYPLTTGVTQATLRRLIAQALDVASRDATFNQALPGLEAPDTLTALKAIHHPASDAEAALLLRGAHPAQRRLIREELLAHQLCMRMLRSAVRDRPAPPLPDAAASGAVLEQVLPFRFTGAQRRVIGEIARDLAQRRPMLRLVQGDVGSGKTAVAAAAMLAAIRAGHQAALMAPTELLAEQHALNFRRWFEPLGVETVLVSGKLKKKQRESLLPRIAAGEVPLVIGTHAVFQSTVAFRSLALVVVDEQHRFGVQQRLALRDKGGSDTMPAKQQARAPHQNAKPAAIAVEARSHAHPGRLTPHQLIMSATPIPRTLAQTLYADLDVSVIDELPPGRSPVLTVAMSNERRADVLVRIGDVCAQGRQAYWVCTLVEESENLEAQAAAETAEQLRRELPQLSVGLVHGRMKPEEKDAAMRAFKSGDTQLLVATTVIEVGVDVPNASIMIIENAERLGLSQLHQLRGRVGRGAVESQCVLMYQAPLSENARARLAVMRATNDGFRIAQQDLELRGPGEILGRRQAGLIGLKLADPVRDATLIPPLQAMADDWLARHPREARALIGRWVGDVEKYAQV